MNRPPDPAAQLEAIRESLNSYYSIRMSDEPLSTTVQNMVAHRAILLDNKRELEANVAKLSDQIDRMAFIMRGFEDEREKMTATIVGLNAALEMETAARKSAGEENKLLLQECEQKGERIDYLQARLEELVVDEINSSVTPREAELMQGQNHLGEKIKHWQERALRAEKQVECLTNERDRLKDQWGSPLPEPAPPAWPKAGEKYLLDMLDLNHAEWVEVKDVQHIAREVWRVDLCNGWMNLADFQKAANDYREALAWRAESVHAAKYFGNGLATKQPEKESPYAW